MHDLRCNDFQRHWIAETIGVVERLLHTAGRQGLDGVYAGRLEDLFGFDFAENVMGTLRLTTWHRGRNARCRPVERPAVVRESANRSQTAAIPLEERDLSFSHCH